MEPRSVEQWMEIMRRMDVPAQARPEAAVADRILGDLVGYSHRSKNRTRDGGELANAMLAYARLMKEAGR